jgi:hypothetical protein
MAEGVSSNLGRRIWIERFEPNLVRTVRSTRRGSGRSDLDWTGPIWIGLVQSGWARGEGGCARRCTPATAFYGSRGYGLFKQTQENQGGELVLTEPWKREKRRRRGVDGEVRAAVAAGLAKEVDVGVLQAPRLHGSTCGAPAKPAEGSAGPEQHRRRAIAAAVDLPAAASQENPSVCRAGVEGGCLGELPGGEAELPRALAGAGVRRSDRPTTEQRCCTAEQAAGGAGDSGRLQCGGRAQEGFKGRVTGAK